ncbi:enolase 4 isoform X5 [Phyllopteryx taeniolatus]|uniref:enolase 4 isoform X5 n=1 Tax=Phyllopteryx taeniolatus TaxID=161469 RepID=UPI002AD52357|nr:enolase 4 isoform X5 [Phyllopteryx taeniolatus]
MSRSVSCLSEEDQEFDEIKNAAAAFYRANRVPEELERALGELFFQNPEDVHGYLANYFTKLSSQPLISRLNGKEVYDSRGQLCAEAEVFCMICNKEKRMSSAAISSHLGQKDPFLDWQAKSEERVYHVKTAVHWIVEPLNKMLKEQNPCDQSDVDQKLRRRRKSRKRKRVTLPVNRKWKFHLRHLKRRKKRRLIKIITMTTQLQKEMMRIMSTSSKAGVTQAILSDSGVLPVNFDRPEQALDLITEACNNLALELGTEIHLAMNCAGPDLMDYTKEKYEIAAGVHKSPDELVAMYQTLISKYTAVVALIDPLRREDREQWEKLSSVIGQSCVLLSDKTNKPQAPPLPGVTGHILKHINEITVSDLISVTSELQGSVLLGTTSNESCDDDSLSDIAVGLGLDYVKLGGLASAERMTKYNRLVSIEEELAQQGILVSKEQHSPPLFTETEEEVV